MLHTEGEEHLLKCTFSEEETPPANYYMGLSTDASIAKDASLGNVTEVSGGGYARQAIASDNVDFTIETHGTNNRRAAAAEQTFAASGADITGARTWFIATTVDNTGKLIASAAVINAPLTIPDGSDHGIIARINLKDTTP